MQECSWGWGVQSPVGKMDHHGWNSLAALLQTKEWTPLAAARLSLFLSSASTLHFKAVMEGSGRAGPFPPCDACPSHRPLSHLEQRACICWGLQETLHRAAQRKLGSLVLLLPLQDPQGALKRSGLGPAWLVCFRLVLGREAVGDSSGQLVAGLPGTHFPADSSVN